MSESGIPVTESEVEAEEKEQADTPGPLPPPRREPERLFDYDHRWPVE